MSQLGQKRRFMPAQAMSAPPPVSGPSMHRSTYALRAIRRLAWFARVTRIPTSLVSAGAGGARPERVQNPSSPQTHSGGIGLERLALVSVLETGAQSGLQNETERPHIPALEWAVRFELDWL
jgi:hypothetical protein